MKKTIKYLIVVAVIAVFSYFYAHVDKKIPIYDTSVDTAHYGNMGPLLQEQEVEQTFICKKEVLSGVSIKCSLWGADGTEKYQYRILQADDKKELRKGEILSKDVKNGRFHTIMFEDIKDAKNKEFIFEFVSETGVNGKTITIYNVPKTKETTSLQLDGNEFAKNTLALKTVSTIFDWETFIVVMVCGLYLYGFLKVLYRFFS
ncbi:MAG TPA: hypothetical protein VIR32_03795 [Lachnospiraceae bacterium]